jgi:hypothetical protein
MSRIDNSYQKSKNNSRISFNNNHNKSTHQLSK